MYPNTCGRRSAPISPRPPTVRVPASTTPRGATCRSSSRPVSWNRWEEHLRPAGHHRREADHRVHRHAARQDGQSPCADGPMAARPVHRHHDAQETAEGAHPVPARRNGHTRKVPDVVHLHRHLSRLRSARGPFGRSWRSCTPSTRHRRVRSSATAV